MSPENIPTSYLSHRFHHEFSTFALRTLSQRLGHYLTSVGRSGSIALSAISRNPYLSVFSVFLLVACYLSANTIEPHSKRKPAVRRCQNTHPPNLDSGYSDLLGLRTLFESARHLNRGKFLPLTLQRFKKTKANTYSCTLLNKSVLHTCEPRNVQTMLALNFNDWSLGDRRKNAFNPVLGHGIFANDGLAWKQSRTALRPCFKLENLPQLKVFEKHTQDLIELLRLHEDSVVDLKSIFGNLTLDVTTEVFFGESSMTLKTLLDSRMKQMFPAAGAQTASAANDREYAPQADQRPPPCLPVETDIAEFSAAFGRAQRHLADGVVLGRWLPLIRGPKAQGQFRRDCRTIHDTVAQYAEAGQRGIKERHADESPEHDRFVFLRELLNSGRSVEDTRFELVNILVAGRDTTSSLLSNLWFVLSRRRDIYANLRTEVCNVLATTHGGSRSPNLSDLKLMPYLHACINEALRLFPPIPINTRTAIRDTVLPCGGIDGSPLFVPKGTSVRYHVFAMHRREDIWGADAAQFRPERWLTAATTTTTTTTTATGKHEQAAKVFRNWSFLPFNGGPRVCLGQKMAQREAQYVTCQMVRAFESLDAVHATNHTAAAPNDMDGEAFKESLTLTLSPAGGVKVRVRQSR